MNLLARFKKDYFNYLISTILPALIAGIAVPVLKNLLGTEAYGEFSIYFNAVLICTAITTGWITQSIYRFYNTVSDKKLFAKLSIDIAIRTQLFFYVPIIIVVWYLKEDLFLGILICIAVFMNSMQFAYLSIAQSSFLSRKTIFSETIRSVSYILIATIFLLIIPQQYFYILFMAIIVSYGLSIFYLRIQTRHFYIQNSKKEEIALTYKSLTTKFFKFGSPLSTWIVFSYSISYIDKLMILHNLGPKLQGNYQAIFDLLSRGLTLLISPVIISLLPLIAQAYEKSEKAEMRKLMEKIILFEFVGFFISAILYWWFGADLLFKILNVPNTDTYWMMGFIVLSGTFVWQIAMVVHQRYVLKLKSLFLLSMIAVALTVQILFFWLFATSRSGNALIYPLGYLIAGVTYLFLLIASQLRIIIKPLLSRVKFIKT